MKVFCFFKFDYHDDDKVMSFLHSYLYYQSRHSVTYQPCNNRHKTPLHGIKSNIFHCVTPTQHLFPTSGPSKPNKSHFLKENTNTNCHGKYMLTS